MKKTQIPLTTQLSWYYASITISFAVFMSKISVKVSLRTLDGKYSNLSNHIYYEDKFHICTLRVSGHPALWTITCPCESALAGNQLLSRVPSNPNHSEVLWQEIINQTILKLFRQLGILFPWLLYQWINCILSLGNLRFASTLCSEKEKGI